MKQLMILLAMFVATTAAAQTSNDDMPAIENWWDKVGADFFGPATMQEPRPEPEIRAQWTGLSADDQAAVIARCGENAKTSTPASAPSQQEGSTDQGKEPTPADLADTPPASPADDSDDVQDDAARATTTTGSVKGAEVQTSQSDASAAPDTGLAGGTGGSAAKMVLICDLVPSL